LQKILASIKDTSDRIGQISAATEEQSATAGELSKAIENVSAITEQNAGSSEEMASSAEELSSQAQSLQEIVGRFKLANEGKGTEIKTKGKKKSEIKIKTENTTNVDQNVMQT